MGRQAVAVRIHARRLLLLLHIAFGCVTLPSKSLKSTRNIPACWGAIAGCAPEAVWAGGGARPAPPSPAPAAPAAAAVRVALLPPPQRRQRDAHESSAALGTQRLRCSDAQLRNAVRMQLQCGCCLGHKAACVSAAALVAAMRWWSHLIHKRLPTTTNCAIKL
jgi:hypothetical protein